MRKNPEGEKPPEKRKPGRAVQWPERVLAKLKEGTLLRIKAVLKPGETQVQFLYDAIEREVLKREKQRDRK